MSAKDYEECLLEDTLPDEPPDPWPLPAPHGEEDWYRADDPLGDITTEEWEFLEDWNKSIEEFYDEPTD